MKEIKELKLQELSTEQKLGMTMIAFVNDNTDLDYLTGLIRSHSLGAVWVRPLMKNLEGAMKAIKEAADYPILIFTDAESGLGEHLIGRHNNIGCTGSEELAYTFGKVTGVTARKMGYNIVCDPIVDMNETNSVCGGVVRSLGGNPDKVVELASAISRGLHDAGILSVAKHYPGKTELSAYIDSHMAETLSTMSKEELIEKNLYPYVKLNEAGLIDGIMTGHKKFNAIDPDYPASLSPKVIGIIRELGFDGIALTDDLMMMGIAAKFGREKPVAMCIGAGNDLSLPYNSKTKENMTSLINGYRDGLIPDERLDEAVRRVLDAQRKVLANMSVTTEITEDDLENFERISRDSIYERHDPEIPPTLDKDGDYYFAIMTEAPVSFKDNITPDVDTFSNTWFNPYAVADKLRAIFKNSVVGTISEFPAPGETLRFLKDVGERETVFITYCNSKAFQGTEEFTPRFSSIITAMQVSGRISTLLHFGNPFVLEELPHVPRVLIGCCSGKSVSYGIDALAGDIEARGVLTYDVKLQ